MLLTRTPTCLSYFDLLSTHGMSVGQYIVRRTHGSTPSIFVEYVQYALVQGYEWVLVLLLLFLFLLFGFFWLRYLRSCVGFSICALSGSCLLLRPSCFVLVHTDFPWLFPASFWWILFLLRWRFCSMLLITDSYCCCSFFRFQQPSLPFISFEL